MSPINKPAQTVRNRRRASAFTDAIADAMVVMLGVSLVVVLGFGSCVVFWTVTT